MAYTKLPIGFRPEEESPVVVVARKTMTDVLKKVRWMCAVVYKLCGKGNEISIGVMDGVTRSTCGISSSISVEA